MLTQYHPEAESLGTSQTGFFVLLQQRVGSILFIYRHVQFRVGKSGYVCAGVSVHKDP